MTMHAGPFGRANELDVNPALTGAGTTICCWLLEGHARRGARAMNDRPRPRWRPWPADRWPTSNELVEFARVTPTAEVTEYFDQLLKHAQRGRDCLLQGHVDRLMEGIDERIFGSPDPVRTYPEAKDQDP